MLWDRYGKLLREPRVRAPLIAGLVARLPLAMYSFAILLLVEERTGSFAAAGLVAAAAGATNAVFLPVQGRLIDRLGQTIPLLAAASVNAAAFVALIVGASIGVGVWFLAVSAALVGASVPSIASSQRALWPVLLRDRRELLNTVLAVDVMLLDLFLIVGPLLVAALAMLASPATALSVAAVLLSTGSLWFASLPASRAWRGKPRTAGFFGPLATPGMRTLLMAIGLTGLTLGILRVALTAFAGMEGSPSGGGVLLATLGVGSLVGGWLYGAREWRLPVARRYVILLALFTAGVLLLALASSMPLMAALTVVAGLALAPVTVCEFVLIPECAPAGTTAEAYAWGITATFGGSALGNASAGVVVESAGWQAGTLMASAWLAVATVVTLTRMRTLRTAN